MRLSDPTNLTLGGDLGERLSRSIRHLRALDTEEMWRELDAPDEVWHWGADYPGRWLGTMALLAHHTGEDYGVAPAFERLIGYQQADGGFSPYSSPTDYKEWFGMGRGLVGLIDYYEATEDPRGLTAASQLGDYYIDRYPTFEPYMYECYSNALEGIVALARLTDDPRYHQFAHQMADASMVFQHIWQSTTLSPQGRRSPCGGQVHCQLTTARGLLDLHELTGEERYLAPVLALHDYICRNTLSVAGGVGFYFNRLEDNEACADADWLRLNLHLWRLTGESRYLELAERTLVNQLPFAQANNGAFCYLRGLQDRSGAAFDVCCSHHAPRALWEVLRYAITSDPGVISINLFLDATVCLPLSGVESTVTTRLTYEPDAVELAVSVSGLPEEPVTIQVRVPEWAGRATVYLNDQIEARPEHAGFVTVERFWSDSDRLTVRFPNPVRVVRGHRVGEHVLHESEAAVFLGPRLFCLSDLHNPTINLHFATLHLNGDDSGGITVAEPSRLEADGVDPAGEKVRLTFTPLSVTGGNPNGIGRSHPALASPFKTWLPVIDTVDERQKGASPM